MVNKIACYILDSEKAFGGIQVVLCGDFFQLPPIHKSQEMTLNTAEIDLGDAFEPGMGYVALSRVRSLSGLKLMNLNEMALKVHPKILEQDKIFNDSLTFLMRLGSNTYE